MYLENKLILFYFFFLVFLSFNHLFIPIYWPILYLLSFGALLGPLFLETLLFFILVSISYTSSFLIVRTILLKFIY